MDHRGVLGLWSALMLTHCPLWDVALASNWFFQTNLDQAIFFSKMLYEHCFDTMFWHNARRMSDHRRRQFADIRFWWCNIGLNKRYGIYGISWWRHQMDTFSALLAICTGNSPVTGEFPAQMPVTWNFDAFFNLRLNNGWVNNREAGDLRRHRTHYDVTVVFMRRMFW